MGCLFAEKLTTDIFVCTTQAEDHRGRLYKNTRMFLFGAGVDIFSVARAGGRSWSGPDPKGGGGVYGPQNCRTEQGALSAPEAPEILFASLHICLWFVTRGRKGLCANSKQHSVLLRKCCSAAKQSPFTVHLVSFVCLRAWTGPAGKGAGFGSTKGGGPPPPYSPPNCRTPLGVTHWLAAAPVGQSWLPRPFTAPHQEFA